MSRTISRATALIPLALSSCLLAASVAAHEVEPQENKQAQVAAGTGEPDAAHMKSPSSARDMEPIQLQRSATGMQDGEQVRTVGNTDSDASQTRGSSRGPAVPVVTAVPDDSRITISGSVASVTAQGFVLDYGDGSLAVEMDSPTGNSGYVVKPGERVTVSGRVDDDLFERKSIEASSVYIESLNTHFFAPSAVDEEDVPMAVVTPIVVSQTMIAGTVAEVGDNQFTVDTGATRITVDVSALPVNPLNLEGPAGLDEGERVSVMGTMDGGFMGQRTLKARSIVAVSRI